MAQSLKDPSRKYTSYDEEHRDAKTQAKLEARDRAIYDAWKKRGLCSARA